MKNFVFDLYGTLADIRTDETSARFRKKTDALMLRKFGIAHFCKQLQAVAPYSSQKMMSPTSFPHFAVSSEMTPQPKQQRSIGKNHALF